MNSSRDGDSHLDDERAAFEAWVSGRTVVKKYGAKLNTRADGSYGDYRINDRWLAWKARAALENAPVADERTRHRNDGFSSLSLWWTMIEAEAELAGAPFSDDEPILDFMGSGASHTVTAGQIRAALASAPAHGDAIDTSPKRVDETANDQHGASTTVAGEAPLPWHLPVQHWTDEEKAKLAPAPQASPAADERDAKDADPLQGAANWLVNGAGVSVYALASDLMIGHDRADRLYDAAIADQVPQQGEA